MVKLTPPEKTTPEKPSLIRVKRNVAQSIFCITKLKDHNLLNAGNEKVQPRKD